MAHENCRLCNPKNITWKEDGFYGFQCFECSSGKTAFIILDEHRGTLTKDEEKKYLELIEKHFPDLESKNLSKNRRNCNHWYEFLIRKKDKDGDSI